MSLKNFRNVTVYRLTENVPALSDAVTLDIKLAEFRAVEIGRHERATSGFVPPMSPETALARAVSKTGTLVTLLMREKILPASVVKDRVAIKVQAIEAQEERKVFARERAQIRDDVEFDLLPQALVKNSLVSALISAPYIFIDTSNSTKAELMLRSLREAVGRLPSIPFSTKYPPSEMMTRWVLNAENEQPDGMTLGEKFKSKTRNEESQTLSGTGMWLSGDRDLRRLLEHSAHEVIEMQLAAQSETDNTTTVPFTLTKNLLLKSVEWPAELETEVANAMGEDADRITRQLAILLLIEHELHNMLARIAASFGGEHVPGDMSDEEDPL